MSMVRVVDLECSGGGGGPVKWRDDEGDGEERRKRVVGEKGEEEGVREHTMPQKRRLR